MMKRKVNLIFGADGEVRGATISVDTTEVERAVKAEVGENPKGWTKKKMFRKVASIPLDIFLSLPVEQQEAITSGDKKALKRVLKRYKAFCFEGDF